MVLDKISDQVLTEVLYKWMGIVDPEMDYMHTAPEWWPGNVKYGWPDDLPKNGSYKSTLSEFIC